MASPSIARERSPIAVLLDPKTDIPLGERDIRLEDFLNDKLQTGADFENLDNLLANVAVQKEQLDKQLQDARTKLAASKTASANHSSMMLEQAREFERQQSDVHRRLMIVTSSDTPEEAVRLLKGPMERLRRVDLAKQYIELLKEVDDLTIDAQRHLPQNPKEALKPYTQLKELAIRLRELQEPAEGAAVHLVNHVERTSTQLWNKMTKQMTDEFEAVLQKGNWPIQDFEPTRDWSDCFERLLDLQYPEFSTSREPLILLPVSCLAKPFIQQFKYNFFSEKVTAQPNKLGNYFFPWFLGTIKKWEHFLRVTVGPVLAAHFRGHILAGNLLYVDPVSAFITALLPIVKEKVNSIIGPIANDPSLLSKFMDQLLNFDESVRISFNYDGGNAECGWKGLAWDVMDTWFDQWLLVEKEFALKRYQDIINAPNSGHIDYDSAPPGKMKTTYGAAQVTDLVKSVTNSYRKLRRFSHKARFLIEIQAEIFDQYQGRLSDSLDAYQTITSPLARKLHGVTKEQQAELEGIGGLDRLCRVYASAEHVNTTLKEWSNQDFFVDLWEELQNRAKRTDVHDNLAGSMTYSVVKESTSNAVGSDSSFGEGSVFDVTIEGIVGVRNRAEGYLISNLTYNFPSLLKHYFHNAQWMTVGDDSISATTSPELDQPLRTLSERLKFLDKILAESRMRRIWREASDSLEDLLWNEVLMRQDFTTLGAARFMDDIAAIQSVASYCHAYSDPGSLPVMEKLNEAALLLNLPMTVQQPGDVSLSEASDAIFASNSGADEMLQRLNLSRISRQDARNIAAKRREAST